MKTAILLPVAAVSLFALAACEQRAGAPATPDPDASAQVEVAPEPVQPEIVVQPEPEIVGEPSPALTEDIQETIEAIEQEAAETFESIMEQTGQAGDTVLDMSTNAMQAITDQLEAAREAADAGQALDAQIAAITGELESLRDEDLTDDQKIQAIASARTTAEQSARALGLTEAEIVAAGDRAEAAARDILEF